MSEHEPPTLAEIRDARERLGTAVRRTPTLRWHGGGLATATGDDTTVFLKLELMQVVGSFKPRGALLRMMALTPEQRAAGVTAVSAGNHAMAVGYAAAALGTSAKVVMPRNANRLRVQRCEELGVEVVLVDDVHLAFEEADRLVRDEGRTFIHPFEGKEVALGTGTVALEFLEDAPGLDAVVVPIGGGGLCAGIATAVKAMRPGCEVFGVEPEGADSMHRSFAAGSPQSIPEVRTIADSLGAPYCAPYSFALCRRFVDALCKVDDSALFRAMTLLYDDVKLAVEPAGAATTAALLGPLRERLRGKRVGLIVCGANLDEKTFADYVAVGRRRAASPTT